MLGPLTDLMRACEGPENRGQLLTSLVQAPIEALDAVAKDEGLLKLLRTWLQVRAPAVAQGKAGGVGGLGARRGAEQLCTLALL